MTIPQVENDIRSMSDEQLNIFIAAHIQQMERSDKELYAQQLEAGYWRRLRQAQPPVAELVEAKRPPEVDALSWYAERQRQLRKQTDWPVVILQGRG